MQLNLTETQLQRIIELLEKVKEKRMDDYLVSYLKQHQRFNLPVASFLDEIPF